MTETKPSGYFFEGYPVEEVKQRYGKEPYRLQLHEAGAIQDIMRSMEKGLYDADHELLEESAAYLQSLAKKLTMVAMSEQNEGIMNMELRTKIEEVKALYAQLVARLQKSAEKQLVKRKLI